MVKVTLLDLEFEANYTSRLRDALTHRDEQDYRMNIMLIKGHVQNILKDNFNYSNLKSI